MRKRTATGTQNRRTSTNLEPPNRQEAERWSSSSTARRLGSDGCAPRPVVAKAPAALAKRQASSIDFFSASATPRAPQKASPAAVVSTLVTGKVGIVRFVSALQSN